MRKLMMIVCCLSLVSAVWAAAPYDGSVPLLCAALTIQECGNDSGECHPRRAKEVNLPPFVKKIRTFLTHGGSGEPVS